MLWDSLLSSTSKVYINPSVVALRIQLVLSAFLPLCILWPLSSYPWIKDNSLESLQYDSQVCVTCLCTRRVVLQLQAANYLLYFSSCSVEILLLQIQEIIFSFMVLPQRRFLTPFAVHCSVAMRKKKKKNWLHKQLSRMRCFLFKPKSPNKYLHD